MSHPEDHVTSNMVIKNCPCLLAGLVAGFLLGGCANTMKDQSVATTASGQSAGPDTPSRQTNPENPLAPDPGQIGSNPTPGPGTGLAPGSKPNPGSAPGSGSVPPRVPERPGLYTIEASKSQNWLQTNEAAELGPRVEAALKRVKEMQVNGEVHYDDAGANTQAKLVAKIRDAKTFSYQFITPKDQGSVGQIIADGQRVEILQKGKWQTAPPLPFTDKPMTDADLTNFFTNVSAYAFRDMTGSKKMWSRFLTALLANVGNYTIKSEKANQAVGKHIRPFFRITGSRNSPSKCEYEVVIDGIEYLPLTIKFNQTLPDGKARRIFVTYVWNQGGHHQASDFVIPSSAP